MLDVLISGLGIRGGSGNARVGKMINTAHTEIIDNVDCGSSAYCSGVAAGAAAALVVAVLSGLDSLDQFR